MNENHVHVSKITDYKDDRVINFIETISYPFNLSRLRSYLVYLKKYLLFDTLQF